jgi:uncharacterized SAM-binding protein YcdF (DUF218 family)
LDTTQHQPPLGWSLFRRIGWGLIALVFLAAGLYVARVPLLRWAADVWIVEDRLERADAILVLGGGLETRPFEAARLYREGLAPRVLVTDVSSGPTTLLGLKPAETDVTRRLLLKEGVPESAIETIGHQVTSTREEALALREALAQTPSRRVIIVTEIFHTRRTRWVFRKVLKGQPVRLQIAPVRPLRYSARDWWRHEEGLIDFETELIKLAYYWLKY